MAVKKEEKGVHLREKLNDVLILQQEETYKILMKPSVEVTHEDLLSQIHPRYYGDLIEIVTLEELKYFIKMTDLDDLKKYINPILLKSLTNPEIIDLLISREALVYLLSEADTCYIVKCLENRLLANEVKKDIIDGLNFSKIQECIYEYSCNQSFEKTFLHTYLEKCPENAKIWDEILNINKQYMILFLSKSNDIVVCRILERMEKSKILSLFREYELSYSLYGILEKCKFSIFSDSPELVSYICSKLSTTELRDLLEAENETDETEYVDSYSGADISRIYFSSTTRNRKYILYNILLNRDIDDLVCVYNKCSESGRVEILNIVKDRFKFDEETRNKMEAKILQLLLKKEKQEGLTFIEKTILSELQ